MMQLEVYNEQSVLYGKASGDMNEDYIYAFYVYENDEVMEKQWYSEKRIVQYAMKNNNVYRIALFVKDRVNADNKPQIISSKEYRYCDNALTPYIRIEEMEMTNYCNLNCKNCPTPTTKYRKGFMDDRTVLMTLSYTKKGQTLNYHRQGEALLHKDLEKYIRWGVDIGIKPVISTNGVLLTEDRLRCLYHAGLRHLVITLHKKQSVEAFLMACQYFKDEKIEVINFNQRHKRTDSDVMYFMGKILDFDDSELGNMKALYTELESDFSELLSHSRPHTWAGNAGGYIGQVDEELCTRRRNACYFINQSVINVRWDGSIVACCFDSENDNELGHISRFEDIKIGDFDCYGLCKSCDANWANGYME